MRETTLSEFIARVHEAKPGTIWGEAVLFARSRGVVMGSYHEYGSALVDGPIAPSLREVGFPTAWVHHYVDAHYDDVDFIVERALRDTVPFFWSDELTQPAGRRLTKAQRAFADDLIQADFGDGIALSVVGPQMHTGYVGLGFGGPRPDWATDRFVAEMHVALQTAHMFGWQNRLTLHQDRYDLSPRERQVLGLMGRGYSNTMIASTMSVSPSTVDTLARRLFDKLNVTDRTSAVLRGLGLGVGRKTPQTGVKMRLIR